MANIVTLGPPQVQILVGSTGRCYAKARVEVHERVDGTVAVIYQGQHVALGALTPAPSTRIPARDHRRLRPKRPQAIQDLMVRKRREGGRAAAANPSPDHPWRHLPVGKTRPNQAG